MVGDIREGRRLFRFGRRVDLRCRLYFMDDVDFADRLHPPAELFIRRFPELLSSSPVESVARRLF